MNRQEAQALADQHDIELVGKVPDSLADGSPLSLMRMGGIIAEGGIEALVRVVQESEEEENR